MKRVSRKELEELVVLVAKEIAELDRRATALEAALLELKEAHGRQD